MSTRDRQPFVDNYGNRHRFRHPQPAQGCDRHPVRIRQVGGGGDGQRRLKGIKADIELLADGLITRILNRHRISNRLVLLGRVVAVMAGADDSRFQVRVRARDVKKLLIRKLSRIALGSLIRLDRERFLVGVTRHDKRLRESALVVGLCLGKGCACSSLVNPRQINRLSPFITLDHDLGSRRTTLRLDDDKGLVEWGGRRYRTVVIGNRIFFAAADRGRVGELHVRNHRDHQDIDRNDLVNLHRAQVTDHLTQIPEPFTTTVIRSDRLIDHLPREYIHNLHAGGQRRAAVGDHQGVGEVIAGKQVCGRRRFLN